MNNIHYDQGTFSYVVMLGALAIPMVYAPPQKDVADHGTSLLQKVYYSGGHKATFNNYGNSIADTHAYILVNHEPFATLAAPVTDGFGEPRTELGRKLLEHRRAALAQGMKLLTVDEINLMAKEVGGEFA